MGIGGKGVLGGGAGARGLLLLENSGGVFGPRFPFVDIEEIDNVEGDSEADE